MKKWCVLVISLFCLQSLFSQQVVGAIGRDIRLPDVNNQTVTLSSLKGKVVLVDFWASWCRPCRQTVPGLKKLYSLYRDKGFEIYGVSLDDNADAWKKAIREDQSAWIHVNDKLGNVANQWVVSVIPTTYLLDKAGKIVAIDEDEKILSKIIGKLLR